MATAKAAWQLLEEFRPWVQRYNFGAAALGVALGAWDGPPHTQSQPEAVPAPGRVHLQPQPEGAPALGTEHPQPRQEGLVAPGPEQPQPQPQSEGALATWKTRPPDELSFLRQLLITTPGIALALRLGRRAREIGAPASALALAALPSISFPLVIYISGYPLGVGLRAWAQGRAAE
mmetsp:Transcript_15330/g.48186  ORF Transcript_15330/g.48186 Transcript_15330/m.48186 type:complete len:176 (+) Transcript_15330:91-618(+)